MQRIRNGYRSLKRFTTSTIEWRHPITPLYLMAVNVAFWLTAFYVEKDSQLRILVTLGATTFGWDVLLSPTHDRNILTHIITWPIHDLFRTSSVGLTLWSAHSLHQGALEQACWSAYGTVGLLLINPVWQYNEVNAKLARCANAALCAIGSATNRFIVRPVVAVYRVLEFIVLLRWVPILFGYITRFLRRIRDAIVGFFVGIYNSIINFFAWIGREIRACRNNFSAYCASLSSRLRNWFYNSIYMPICRFLKRTREFLRYWFCAHWWPGLRAWLVEHIGRPVQRWFNYVCYGIVYVVCGYWVKPLGRLLLRGAKAVLCWAKTSVWEPLKVWLLVKFDLLFKYTKRVLHRLAILFRDSVLYPVCMFLWRLTKHVYGLFHEAYVRPALDYSYLKYKLAEDFAFIYVLGPVCKTIVENIPEKSPFCDDTDTELADLLPNAEGVESDVLSDTETDVDLPHSNLNTEGPSTPVAKEEADFISGLQFPTIHASESSDEEFDLNAERRRSKVRRRRPSKKRSEIATSTSEAAASDFDIDEAQLELLDADGTR
uniref:TLC domain-containing protein n=1 Tax=Steinernema glaseri TaxID=37863 RepID=A0A1I7ZHS4_9BILA